MRIAFYLPDQEMLWQRVRGCSNHCLFTVQAAKDGENTRVRFSNWERFFFLCFFLRWQRRYYCRQSQGRILCSSVCSLVSRYRGYDTVHWRTRTFTSTSLRWTGQRICISKGNCDCNKLDFSTGTVLYNLWNKCIVSSFISGMKDVCYIVGIANII